MRELGLIVLAALVCACGDPRSADAGIDGVDGGPDAAAIDAGTDAGPLRDAGCGLACETTCEDAASAGSHLGCTFWVVDLDNASLSFATDAAGEPFAVAVSNPGTSAAQITIERDQAAVGEAPDLVVLATATVPAGSSETIELGRHELDGASETGFNDGTHTALSANALRLRSTAPVAVHQLNPLHHEGAFSSDVSLLLPEHLLGARYSVVAWPQTIANDDTNPNHDFDPAVSDEDLRAFLTIVGTRPSTSVTVTLGADVVRVVGAGAIAESGPGDVIEVVLGAHEVLNLETQGFMADFSGSLVTASEPIAVFVGSEASDVPTFTSYFERSCCGDHLEAQLAPDDRLGRRFLIARTPDRTRMLNAAFSDSTVDSVGEFAEADSVRILAVEAGTTIVTTSLPAPDDRFELAEREWIEIRTNRDYEILADRRISVLQAISSQEAVGIPTYYPGGDPSLFAVVPVEQYRADHVFSAPDGFPFDSLTIVAPAAASVLLDGAVLPAECTTAPIAAGFVAHRCQLSFPVVQGTDLPVLDGAQDDGWHRVSADAPISVIVSGFAQYTSYAFTAGLSAP